MGKNINCGLNQWKIVTISETKSKLGPIGDQLIIYYIKTRWGSPVENRPPHRLAPTLWRRKKIYIKNLIFFLSCDEWHLRCDKLKCDMWHTGGGGHYL